MAIVDSILIFFISLLIGAIGIHVGATMFIDRDIGYGHAIITALIGALIWGLVSFFVGWLPIIGPILMLIAWIAVINWSYPGGWLTAAGIGFVAWIVAALILYALAMLGVITPGALGVPGA